MTRDDVAERAVAMRSAVANTRLRRPEKLVETERARVFDALGALMPLGWVVDDRATLSVGQLAGTARRMKRKDGLDLVVVDYLQLLAPEDPKEVRQEQVARMSRGLKALARDLNVPVVVLSQLNREVERREDRMPRMSDLRESGAIEQDSDVVVLMHRPAYYKPEDRPGLTQMIVAKNRNGPTGVVDLTWDGETYASWTATPPWTRWPARSGRCPRGRRSRRGRDPPHFGVKADSFCG
jgi:replicative DNA helicase